MANSTPKSGLSIRYSKNPWCRGCIAFSASQNTSGSVCHSIGPSFSFVSASIQPIVSIYPSLYAFHSGASFFRLPRFPTASPALMADVVGQVTLSNYMVSVNGGSGSSCTHQAGRVASPSAGTRFFLSTSSQYCWPACRLALLLVSSADSPLNVTKP